MKRLVVTGASGLVGTELIHVLLGCEGWEIVAVSGCPDLLVERYSGEPRISCVTLEGLEDELVRKQADATVHLAWSRSSAGLDISSSLDYLEHVLGLAKSGALGTFVYMSSQGVYGQGRKPFWPESLPAAPGYPYAVGKYAGEVLVRAVLGGGSCRLYLHTSCFGLRECSLHEYFCQKRFSRSDDYRSRWHSTLFIH